MSNTALVQVLQFIILLFYFLVVVAACNARVNLPKTKIESLLDILLVAILWVYALALKIIFST